MRFVLFVFVFLFLGLVKAQNVIYDYEKFPSYDSVVTHFFTTDNFVSFQHKYEFSFQKKTQGWFIVTKSKSNPLDVDTVALWLSDTNAFVLQHGKVNFGEYHSKIYIKNTIASFLKFPFWGYEGYISDNLNYYKNKALLLPDDLHKMALLYVSQAALLIDSNKELNTDTAILKQLETSYVNCLVVLRKLREKYPDFCLPDLSVDEMVAYRRLDFAFLYEAINQKELADRIFTTTQLPHFIKQYWHLYLREANQNAIIMANSKQEAYPLLWLQKNGFREDVSIVYLGLLSERWYREELLKGKSALCTFNNFETLPDITLTYNSEAQQANVFTQILKTRPDSALFWQDKGVKAFKIKAQKVILTSGQKGGMIAFNYNRSLSKAQLFYYLIVTQNMGNKQLLFTSPHLQNSFGLSNKYIRRNNLLHELNWLPTNSKGLLSTYDDAPFAKNKMLNFKFSDFNCGPNNWVMNQITAYNVAYLSDALKHKTVKFSTAAAKKIYQNIVNDPPEAHFNLFYLVHLCNKSKVNTNALSDFLVNDLKSQALKKIQYKAGINILANRIITLLSPEQDGYLLNLMTKQFPID